VTQLCHPPIVNDGRVNGSCVPAFDDVSQRVVVGLMLDCPSRRFLQQSGENHADQDGNLPKHNAPDHISQSQEERPLLDERESLETER